MNLPSQPQLGRYDGILELAEHEGLMQPMDDCLQDAVSLAQQAAVLIVENPPTPEEIEELRRYSQERGIEVGKQIRFVDQGRFLPQPDSEFDEDFGMAAREMLAFYRQPYFRHNAEGARLCTTFRILEATDERYSRYKLIERGLLLQKLVGQEGLIEIANTQVN